jgi:hypothetical protein
VASGQTREYLRDAVLGVRWLCWVTGDWRGGSDARRGLEVREPLGGGLERA